MKPAPTVRTRILRGTPRELAILSKALQRGELVAVPTETVYGLAANALDAAACRKIFAAKGRPSTDPLIVHLHAAADLALVAESNEAAQKLAQAFWPGPLTLVLPKKPIVPDVVSAGLPSLAVRVPSHPLFRRLLKRTGLPLAAPSANPFGYVSPTTAEHVLAGLGGKIRYILDGGPSTIGLESTILDLRDPQHPRLLRPGAVTKAQLERVLRQRIAVGKKKTGAAKNRAQVAPGMLARHYSPRTPVVLHARLSSRQARASEPTDAWVFLAKPAKLSGRNIHWLDVRGDLRRAGRRLFAMLRKLDAGNFRVIHVELATGQGLADAINDRLRRAAAKA